MEDGFAVIALPTAIKLGLVSHPAPADTQVLVKPWQFRAVVFMQDSNETCLCKGMLIVSNFLQTGIEFNAQCVKLRTPGAEADTLLHVV